MSFAATAVSPCPVAPALDKMTSPLTAKDADIILTLRREVQKKNDELTFLKNAFDELRESSQDIEKELEAELDRAEGSIENLRKDHERQRHVVASLEVTKRTGSQRLEN